MKHRLALAAFTLGSALSSSFAYAAAFQLYEVGAPVNGTAGVGQAVITNNASTSYFNPAGMSQLPASALLLGAQGVLTYTNFSPSSANTIKGTNGSNAGGLIPGVGAFFAYRYSPKLSFGASLTMPYAGALNYDNHWVGRYLVQQLTFYTVDLNPSVSYQLNRWAAIGGGVTVEYANLYQTNALHVTTLFDGQATVKVADTRPGFNLGVLLTPYHSTKVGVAYRSQIVHHLSGNANFANISVVPAVKTKLVMPTNLIASISQGVTNKLTLLGEAGWANWSSMTDTVLTVAGYSVAIPQNWFNTYRLGVGAQYSMRPNWMLQAGVSYDSSPTSSSKRLPNLPMDRQIRVGLGTEYNLIPAVTLGLSYEYLNFGKASIHNNSALGTLAGSYSRNYGNFIQASLNVLC